MNTDISEMQSEGRIEVIFGPMFSGKSSEMMRKVRRFEHAKKKCFVINYLHDNRYAEDQCMATHDKITMKAVKTNKLEEVYQRAVQHDVVAIDEGQFFPNIAQFCDSLANQGIVVIVAALDGTFQKKPFGNILNLIPLAEKVIKLSAVCMVCFKEAAFTKRTVDSQEIELIGGAETYQPVCRRCFQINSDQNQTEETPLQQKMLESNVQKHETNPEIVSKEVKIT